LKGDENFGDQKLAKWGGVIQIGSLQKYIFKLFNNHFIVFHKVDKMSKIFLEVETNHNYGWPSRKCIKKSRLWRKRALNGKKEIGD
jgi:hypothetical protein